MRRTDRERTREEALRIARAADFATLCHLNPADGAPRGVPVSPAVADDGVVYWHSAALPGAKADALDADLRACLTFVARCVDLGAEHSTDYASAVITGVARRVSDPEEKRRAALLICRRHAGAAAADRSAAYYAESSHLIDVWRLDPEEVTGKSRGWEAAAREFESRGF